MKLVNGGRSLEFFGHNTWICMGRAGMTWWTHLRHNITKCMVLFIMVPWDEIYGLWVEVKPNCVKSQESIMNGGTWITWGLRLGLKSQRSCRNMLKSFEISFCVRLLFLQIFIHLHRNLNRQLFLRRQTQSAEGKFNFLPNFFLFFIIYPKGKGIKSIWHYIPRIYMYDCSIIG